MKTRITLIVVMLLAVLLAACGGGAATPASKFRVAVVMPSAINDMAFSQSMYNALKAIQQEVGEANFELKYSENMTFSSSAGLIP